MGQSTNNAQVDFSSSSQAEYYLEKYGDDVLIRLREAACFWESEGKLQNRNTFLRLADEIQMEYPQLRTWTKDT